MGHQNELFVGTPLVVAERVSQGDARETQKGLL